MPAVERPAFIGTYNSRTQEFIRSSKLELVGDVARMPYEQKLKTSADIFLSQLSPGERKKVQKVWIIDDFPDILLDNARNLIANGNGSEKIAKEFFPKLVVIELGSRKHRDYVDENTKIRVAAITDAEIKEVTKMHPTPAS